MIAKVLGRGRGHVISSQQLQPPSKNSRCSRCYKSKQEVSVRDVLTVPSNFESGSIIPELFLIIPGL
jgi:hypothetical protein